MNNNVRKELDRFNENLLKYIHYTTDDLEYTAGHINEFLEEHEIPYDSFRRIFLYNSSGEGADYLDFFKLVIDATKEEEKMYQDFLAEKAKKSLHGDSYSDTGILKLPITENTKTVPPSEEERL